MEGLGPGGGEDVNKEVKLLAFVKIQRRGGVGSGVGWGRGGSMVWGRWVM